MTLLDRILARGPELPSDPIIAARIERHLRRIQPDPLFRQRLRSVVVNRYVASREGLALPALRPRARRQMGLLGRGVLYASLVTAASVSAVGAAAQGSLPGDALYGVKLEIEELRMRVAPPGLRDDLAAMALDQRLDEVEQLASAGRWSLVPEAAGRAAAAEAALERLAPGAASSLLTGENSMERHAERLAQLMATAPVSALDGLQRALSASTAAHASNGSRGSGNGGSGLTGGGPSRGPQSAPGGVPHDPRTNGPRQSSGTPGHPNSGNQANGTDASGNDGSQRAASPSPGAQATATPQPSDGARGSGGNQDQQDNDEDGSGQ